VIIILGYKCKFLDFFSRGSRALIIVFVLVEKCELVASLLVVFAEVPQGRPTVRVKETSPNMVVLEVEPPRHNGGKEVSGYRVEFGRKMTDYAVGVLA